MNTTMKPNAEIPKVPLGATGITVSQLGFGTYDLGVPSSKISPDHGGEILRRAHQLGVTLWDTSDDYGSHPHVASALKHVPRAETVICTKTSAESGREAAASLARSLGELGTDYVDIFLLHAVEAGGVRECRRVLKDLGRVKRAGTVRAIGLSTHSVTVVRLAAGFEEVDVIMTICCKADQAILRRYRKLIPLEDGSMEEMLRALELAHHHGKGTIAMKVLGNGAPPLIEEYSSSIQWVAGLGFVDAMVIGMKDAGQVEENVRALAPDRRTRQG